MEFSMKKILFFTLICLNFLLGNNEDFEPLFVPHPNEGTHNLEISYPWLIQEMNTILNEDENFDPYIQKSAYFSNLEDLNGDGVNELYLYNSFKCGSGGCSFRIFQLDMHQKALKEIFEGFSPEIKGAVIQETHHGWKMIKNIFCSGAAHCTEYIFRYDENLDKYVQHTSKKL